MTELITDKKEIEKIISEKIKGKKLVFTTHYKLGSANRAISDETVLEIIPKFEKVIAIEIDKLKLGDIGYELFYQISNNLTFSIATVPKEDKVKIIHVVEYRRSLSKRFRQK